LQFLIQKIFKKNFTAVNFFQFWVIKTLDPDPDRYSPKMLDPDPESMNPDQNLLAVLLAIYFMLHLYRAIPPHLKK
jgi:hypothetical protein